MPRPRRFTPRPDATLRLDRDVATDAIRAYNSNSRVQAQEQAAFEALGDGFSRHRVDHQLRSLDTAYRTRSVHADLAIIAARIESDFGRWEHLLSRSTPLALGATDADLVSELLAFFLSGNTRRKPRSLATKALHFGAPLAFPPADSYAANFLGSSLGAGNWNHTNDLGTAEMAVWFADYLEVAASIAAANSALLDHLLALDRTTSAGPWDTRVRGWPKLLDKILWWLGQPEISHRKLFVAS